MGFMKQCKGKDLDKVPTSKLDKGTYLVGRKYDGNYVQIHKFGDNVVFYTSGGKPFKIQNIEEELVKLNPSVDFVIEAEYIGTTDGSLGSRGKCTTTTFRTNTSKGITNIHHTCNFMAFDIIYYHNKNLDFPHSMSETFCQRLKHFDTISLGAQIKQVTVEKMELDIAIKNAKYEVDVLGVEGLFAKKETHLYRPGKRVNDAVKIKFYPRKILKCVGTKPGEGKYNGMIGSFVLDDNGTEVFISGMDDEMRSQASGSFIGCDIEFEYESFNKTYIQARFKRIVTPKIGYNNKGLVG